MIKIITTEKKELYLWLNAKESGKNKITVNITISEDLETCKKNMEMITEYYWHKKLDIPQSFTFDATPDLDDKGKNKNTLTVRVMDTIKGTAPFRNSYHELTSEEIKSNKLITKTEILL
jgi:hypothetical protein